MNLKQSLHSLLADNETAEVIKQLRSITKTDLTPLHDEVEQISTRFQQNIENSHHELSDESSINRENSSIRYALFAVINKLPEGAILPAAQQAKRLRIAAFMVLCVTLFALIAFNYADFFNKETPKTAITPLSIEPPKVVTEPIVAPLNAPKTLVDTVPKVDTLRKKRVRRIKKAPPVAIGDTFKVN
jgi:Effector-associated domain 11